MKMLLCVCAVMAMTLSAATGPATDVTGSWSAEAKTPDGNSFQLTFTFKQDGSALTGTVQGPMGDPIAISNGKIDGGKFSFDVSFNGMTINHQCTVISADEIKMSAKADSGDFPGMELALKRANAAPPVAPAPPAAPSAPATPAQPSQPPQ